MPIPGFPGIGPTGGMWIQDGTGAYIANVTADGELWIGGALMYSILAELRVHSVLLAAIANIPDNLLQLRSDAVADMGTLYAASPATPTPSS